MRTITVTQPALTSSELSLAEKGVAEGRFGFRGLRRRTAWLELGGRTMTFTTVGLLGRTVRVADVEGDLGEFRQSGLRMKGEATVGDRRYRLRSSGVLSYRFEWLDPQDREAVRLKVTGMLRTSAAVEVADGVDPTDAAVLIGLGLVVARQVADGDSSASAGA